MFKKNYSPSVELDYILLKFVLFILEHGNNFSNLDIASNFKLEGKYIGVKLFEFLK